MPPTRRQEQRQAADASSLVHNQKHATCDRSIITHHQKITHRNIMNQGTQRSILRWIHIIFAIPIVGYIYSPFEEIPNYAPVVRYVAVPAIVLSGLWMWKGHVVRRLISKRSAEQDTKSEK
jgi:hypothetical protein